MGVPKFFRWISERYPKINQRMSFPPNPDTYREHFHHDSDFNVESSDYDDGDNDDGEDAQIRPLPPPPLEQPDAMSVCGLAPPIDRLYLDMNGILHGCSHNNDSTPSPTSTNISGSGSDATPGTSTTMADGGKNTTADGDDEKDQPPRDDDEGSHHRANKITKQEIFQNVCYYLDRLVSDIAQPTEMIYMAIDGVAPRAKLNQQRSRRYRSGKEGEIEQTVYEAHMHQMQFEQKLKEEAFATNGTTEILEGSLVEGLSSSSMLSSSDKITEVEPGRFTGKFETKDVAYSEIDPPLASSSQNKNAGGDQHQDDDDDDTLFHSNSITPGTPFFTECTDHLKQFIRYKLTNDPKWQKLTIIFSGPDVPGEGEHKIMDFMRTERQRPDYNPNLGHCIMGQDGDLIMLGLATHEPNLVLLRERVIFDMAKKRLLEQGVGKNGEVASIQESLGRYTHNHSFEFLHMGVLRDYLSYEFETSNVLPSNKWDLERTIDDFVFMTFFVGNDFLPHMPALDIADEAFDLLFYTYKQQRKKWRKGGQSSRHGPYLTNAGNIVSGNRLEHYLNAVGGHEVDYYENKKRTESEVNEKMRKMDKKDNRESTIPSNEVLASKEEADRAKYREMIESVSTSSSDSNAAAKGKFTPVMLDKTPVFRPEVRDEEKVEAGLMGRMGQLLQNSLSGTDDTNVGNSSSHKDGNKDGNKAVSSDYDQDMKGRYYYDKLGITPLDAKSHVSLRKAYIEGLLWNLKYYYEGCVSWEWYYPYHYGPLLSDLVNLDKILKDVSFDDLGEPLRPYEQLMGCMPPSSSNLLPEPYRWLLTDKSSPIHDFYPESFTVDMNGKRWPWEAVVLLPFIDSKRLIEASRKHVPATMLDEKERQRNEFGKPHLFLHDPDHRESVPAVSDMALFREIKECTAKMEPFETSDWNFVPKKKAVFRPELKEGVNVPQPGFPTLQEAPIQSLWRRRIYINIFGMKSRYTTALLEMADDMPEFPPASVLGPKFIGTTVFIGYPYLSEGFVTAVSDSEVTIRGKNAARYWNKDEKVEWDDTRNFISRRCERGEGLVGTGGWKIPECKTTLSVRPLGSVKTMPDGTRAKSFARFEVEVPLYAALWSPSRPDPRIAGIPTLLEKDPFFSGAEKKHGRKVFMRNYKSRGSKASREGVDILEKIRLGGEQSPILPPFDEAKSASGILRGSLPGALSTAGNGLPRSGTRRGMLSASSAQYKAPLGGGSGRQYTTRSVSASSIIKRQGGIRGRLLAVGAASAAVFFANGSFTQAQLLKPSIGKSSTLAGCSNWGLAFRGGDQEEETEDPFGLKHDMATPPPPQLEFAHGTTTLSFVFQGGIIAAVDSRASIGNFVGSKTTQKVLPVSTHILGTMAGGAADCGFWIRKLKAEAQLHELKEGRSMSVARASRILSNALYQNRGLDLSVGTMIMGFDDEQDGGKPSIYYVDNTGVRLGGNIFSVGSGSTFALGILDTHMRFDMTNEEAISLGIKAIRHATFRDAFSGGFIGVYLITKDGWEKVFSEDLAKSVEQAV